MSNSNFNTNTTRRGLTAVASAEASSFHLFVSSDNIEGPDRAVFREQDPPPTTMMCEVRLPTTAVPTGAENQNFGVYLSRYYLNCIWRDAEDPSATITANSGTSISDKIYVRFYVGPLGNNLRLLETSARGPTGTDYDLIIDRSYSRIGELSSFPYYTSRDAFDPNMWFENQYTNQTAEYGAPGLFLGILSAQARNALMSTPRITVTMTNNREDQFRSPFWYRRFLKGVSLYLPELRRYDIVENGTAYTEFYQYLEYVQIMNLTGPYYPSSLYTFAEPLHPDLYRGDGEVTLLSAPAAGSIDLLKHPAARLVVGQIGFEGDNAIVLQDAILTGASPVLAGSDALGYTFPIIPGTNTGRDNVSGAGLDQHLPLPNGAWRGTPLPGFPWEELLTPAQRDIMEERLLYNASQHATHILPVQNYLYMPSGRWEGPEGLRVGERSLQYDFGRDVYVNKLQILFPKSEERWQPRAINATLQRGWSTARSDNVQDQFPAYWHQGYQHTYPYGQNDGGLTRYIHTLSQREHVNGPTGHMLLEASASPTELYVEYPGLQDIVGEGPIPVTLRGFPVRAYPPVYTTGNRVAFSSSPNGENPAVDARRYEYGPFLQQPTQSWLRRLGNEATAERTTFPVAVCRPDLTPDWTGRELPDGAFFHDPVSFFASDAAELAMGGRFGRRTDTAYSFSAVIPAPRSTAALTLTPPAAFNGTGWTSEGPYLSVEAHEFLMQGLADVSRTSRSVAGVTTRVYSYTNWRTSTQTNPNLTTTLRDDGAIVEVSGADVTTTYPNGAVRTSMSLRPNPDADMIVRRVPGVRIEVILPSGEEFIAPEAGGALTSHLPGGLPGTLAFHPQDAIVITLTVSISERRIVTIWEDAEVTDETLVVESAPVTTTHTLTTASVPGATHYINGGTLVREVNTDGLGVVLHIAPGSVIRATRASTSTTTWDAEYSRGDAATLVWNGINATPIVATFRHPGSVTEVSSTLASTTLQVSRRASRTGPYGEEAITVGNTTAISRLGAALRTVVAESATVDRTTEVVTGRVTVDNWATGQRTVGTVNFVNLGFGIILDGAGVRTTTRTRRSGAPWSTTTVNGDITTVSYADGSTRIENDDDGSVSETTFLGGTYLTLNDGTLRVTRGELVLQVSPTGTRSVVIRGTTTVLRPDNDVPVLTSSATSRVDIPLEVGVYLGASLTVANNGAEFPGNFIELASTTAFRVDELVLRSSGAALQGTGMVVDACSVALNAPVEVTPNVFQYTGPGNTRLTLNRTTTELSITTPVGFRSNVLPPWGLLDVLGFGASVRFAAPVSVAGVTIRAPEYGLAPTHFRIFAVDPDTDTNVLLHHATNVSWSRRNVLFIPVLQVSPITASSFAIVVERVETNGNLSILNDGDTFTIHDAYSGHDVVVRLAEEFYGYAELAAVLTDALRRSSEIPSQIQYTVGWDGTSFTIEVARMPTAAPDLIPRFTITDLPLARRMGFTQFNTLGSIFVATPFASLPTTSVRASLSVTFHGQADAGGSTNPRTVQVLGSTTPTGPWIALGGSIAPWASMCPMAVPLSQSAPAMRRLRVVFLRSHTATDVRVGTARFYALDTRCAAYLNTTGLLAVDYADYTERDARYSNAWEWMLRKFQVYQIYRGQPMLDYLVKEEYFFAPSFDQDDNESYFDSALQGAEQDFVTYRPRYSARPQKMVRPAFAQGRYAGMAVGYERLNRGATSAALGWRDPIADRDHKCFSWRMCHQLYNFHSTGGALSNKVVETDPEAGMTARVSKRFELGALAGLGVTDSGDRYTRATIPGTNLDLNTQDTERRITGLVGLELLREATDTITDPEQVYEMEDAMYVRLMPPYEPPRENDDAPEMVVVMEPTGEPFFQDVGSTKTPLYRAADFGLTMKRI